MRFQVFLQTLLTGVGAAHHWRLARHATGGWRGKLRSTESARSFPAKTLLCVSVNRRVNRAIVWLPLTIKSSVLNICFDFYFVLQKDLISFTLYMSKEIKISVPKTGQ